MSDWVDVAPADDFPAGSRQTVDVDDVPIIVFNLDGQYFAIEDVCTHDDGPLGEGQLEGCEIECPRHGARFDVRTGQVTRMPAAAPVESFATKVEDGRVFVELDEEDL